MIIKLKAVNRVWSNADASVEANAIVALGPRTNRSRMLFLLGGAQIEVSVCSENEEALKEWW